MHIIKTALLSYGMSGKLFHAPFIMAHPGFQLTGAWERSHKNIEQDYNVNLFERQMLAFVVKERRRRVSTPPFN